MFVILALLIILVLLVFYCKKPYNFPPGPVSLPFLSSSLTLGRQSKVLGGQHKALCYLSQKYKTNVLGIKLSNSLTVVALSFDTIRTILRGEEYVGRPNNYFVELRSMGTNKGITFTDGDFWFIQRNFLVRHLREFGFGKNPMEEMIKEQLYGILSILNTNGSGIQVNKLLSTSVLSVLWQLVAGSTISRHDTQMQLLLDILHTRSKSFDMNGGLLSQYPWLRFLAPDWSGYNLIKKLNEGLYKFFIETIREHQANGNDEISNDVISAFLKEMNNANSTNTTFTEDQLVMVCADIFIAGSVTTSSLLNFAFLMVILKPDIQKKIQAEIDSVVQSSSTLSYEDKQRLPYTQAVLMEIERYFTVAPIIGPRRVLKNTTLEGYTIPKNTTVLLNIYAVHMDETFWGDPNVFRPERFLSKDGQIVPTERLLTFGIGKRRCLGEALARYCIFLFFVGIIKDFKIESIPGQNQLSDKPLPGITLSPQPYLANFVKRN